MNNIPVEIKQNQNRKFLKFCRENGVNPHKSGRFDGRDGYKVYKYVITSPIRFKAWDRKSIDVELASILYSLYSTRNLILLGHEYPSYDLWKQDHRGYELDHIMPKSKFPEYTFEVSNWQPLTSQENRKKCSKVYASDAAYFINNIGKNLMSDMDAFLI